ncbi:MAG: hypothetical protein HYY14_02115 [Candidatus Omnitrophica bacterium]|nr:hypothetical protein [Candidatus Omnitrophota bacterium]
MKSYNEAMRILWAAILVLAFLVRIYDWHSVFPAPGEIVFVFDDPYYHMRRAELALQNFPQLVGLDYYSNYPQGALEVWPPLFDHCIIWLGWALGLGHPTLYSIRLAGAFIAPLFALATLAVLFAFSRRFLGSRAALIASLLLAVIPSHVSRSLLARPDHHVAEAFFFLCSAGLFLAALNTGGPRRRLFCSFGSGLALGASILSSVVSIGFLLPGLVLLAGVRLMRLKDKDLLRRAAEAHTLMLLSALALVAPIALTSARARQWLFDYEHFSWFQPAALVGALAVSGLFLLTAPSAHANLKKRAAAFALACAGLAAVAFVSPVRHALKDSLNFLSRSDPVIATVLEARPLLYLTGPFSLKGPWQAFGLLLPLLVPAFVTLWRVRKEKPSPYSLLLLYLLAWTVTTLGLTLCQIRFELWAAFPVILITAAALSEWWPKLAKIRRGWAAVVMLAIVLAPFAQELRFSMRASFVPNEDLKETYLWLKEHTPSPGDYNRPGEPPAWAVLAPWEVGHHLMYYSQRPVVADNFLWNAPKSIRFYLAQEEGPAYSILEETRARYILTQWMPPAEGQFQGMIRVMGGRRADYFELIRSAPGKMKLDFKEPFQKSLYARLHLFDGNRMELGELTLNSASRLRLVYESATAVIGVEGVPTRGSKVFEFVQGAELIGAADPGTHVTLALPVRTNHLRGFVWLEETTADAEGRFKVRVPYATRGTPYRTRPTGPYQVKIQDKTHLVEVTEQEVQTGTQIFL